jgi:hypothetical protein
LRSAHQNDPKHTKKLIFSKKNNFFKTRIGLHFQTGSWNVSFLIIEEKFFCQTQMCTCLMLHLVPLVPESWNKKQIHPLNSYSLYFLHILTGENIKKNIKKYNIQEQKIQGTTS